MIDVVVLANEALRPREVGNLVLPIRAALDGMRSASEGARHALVALIRDVLDGATRVPADERNAVVRLVEGRRPAATGWLREDLDELLRRTNAMPVSPSISGPGGVNVLFAAEGTFLGRSFGAVHTLDVRAEPWGGKIELQPPGGQRDIAIHQAFGRGATAALDLLWHRVTLTAGRQMGPSAFDVLLATPSFTALHGAQLFNNYLVHGEFPTLTFTAKGESVGLGAAMAVLSRLLEAPVDGSTGFSGRVDGAGRVHPVKGLDAKLAAAADRGLTRVVVPICSVDALEDPVPVGVEVIEVETVAQAAAHLFTGAQLRAAIERLKALEIPEAAKRRSWRAAAGDSQSKRVLLTAVGKSDPIGTLKDRTGRPILQEDGPILTLVRDLRPDAVYLFFTTTPAGSPNDFLKNAGKVVECVREQAPECDVVLVPLDDVTDPTDVEQMLPAFRRHVDSVVDGLDSSAAAFFANVTSGTPQMQIVWHLLAERRVLPGVLLQVREARFAKGEPQVRTVALPG